MREAPQTILQLTSQGDGGGSTQSIFNLSEQLARRGHRVLVGCRAESLLYGLARGAGLEPIALDFRRIGRLARELALLLADRRGGGGNAPPTRARPAWGGRRARGALAPRRGG